MYQWKGHTIRSYSRVRCFGFSGLIARSHADFSGADLSFFLSNGSRTMLFETCFAKLGRFSVLWLSASASQNIETWNWAWTFACAYGLATHPEMSGAADLLLKTTLWTTWTTTRTTKADSVLWTPSARKPATMNGSIPFPYYMWYSTISTTGKAKNTTPALPQRQ